jgi:hypothetical protein
LAFDFTKTQTIKGGATTDTKCEVEVEIADLNHLLQHMQAPDFPLFVKIIRRYLQNIASLQRIVQTFKNEVTANSTGGA